MGTNIVGDPTMFAIEYCTLEGQNSKLPYGMGRLWLSGIFLGDIGVNIYITSLYSDLYGLASNCLTLSEPFEDPESPRQLLGWMDGNGLPEPEPHYFLPIEGFDDFVKLVFRQDHFLVFYWALDPEIADLPKYAEYPKQVFKARVHIETFKNVVLQFREKLLSENSTVPL